MPSASATQQIPPKEGPVDALTPFKQTICIMEHKMRNLEKRRIKLEGYMEEIEQGKELNEDQMNAISRHDGVVQTLDLSKEYHKQFTQIMNETGKNLKKQAKQAEHEKTRLEFERVQDILIVQDILNNMGSDDIRSDFLEGKNGAPTLTEEQLKHLDDIYKLISTDQDNAEDPSKPKAYKAQLASASRHFVSLLQGRAKQVLNTTYKDILELIMKIYESGYFDKRSESEENKETTNNEEDVAEVNGSEGTSDQLEEDLSRSDSDPLVQPIDNVVVNQTNELTNTPIQEPIHPSTLPMDSSFFTSTAAYQGRQITELPVTTGGGTQVYAPLQHTRPITEVIGSGGSFNFLQESQIDMESPHMDPAVVVAHPMAIPTVLPYTAQQVTDPSLANQFARGGPVEDNGQSGMTPAQLNTGSSNFAAQRGLQIQPQLHNTTSHTEPSNDFGQPIQSQTFTNQNYTASQTLPQPAAFSGRPGFPSQVDQPAPFKSSSRQVFPGQTVPSPYNDNATVNNAGPTVAPTANPEPLPSQPEPTPHYPNPTGFEPTSYKQAAQSGVTESSAGSRTTFQGTTGSESAARSNYQIENLAHDAAGDYQEREDGNVSGGFGFQQRRGGGGGFRGVPRGGSTGGPRGGGRGGPASSSTNGFGGSRTSSAEKPGFGTGRNERGGSNNYGNFRDGSNYYQERSRDGQGNRDGIQREGGFGSSNSYNNNGFKRSSDRGGSRGGPRGGPRGGAPQTGQRPPRKEGFAKPVSAQS